MNSTLLTKSVGALVKLEWGVQISFDPPFLTGTNKGKPFKIYCGAVEHINGVIPQVHLMSQDVTNIILLILNKTGNNLVMLSNQTTKKLLTQDVSMRELANGIIYKNEIEYATYTVS